ncbi:MAG: hypothetical protein V3W34_13960 [Phycisphaerae bacterium]
MAQQRQVHRRVAARRPDVDGDIGQGFARRCGTDLSASACACPHAETHRIEATAGDWPKWLPSDPTCPHWYANDHFERLVAGYVAHDADRGQDRTVRELIREFRGITGTAKQKAVLEATGLARTNLTALVDGNGISTDTTQRLLAVMKEKTKPVKPAALGIIGKPFCRHRRRPGQSVGCQVGGEAGRGHVPAYPADRVGRLRRGGGKAEEQRAR